MQTQTLLWRGNQSLLISRSQNCCNSNVLNKVWNLLLIPQNLLLHGIQTKATASNCPKVFHAGGPASLPHMSLYTSGHKMFTSLLCKLQTFRKISKPQIIIEKVQWIRRISSVLAQCLNSEPCAQIILRNRDYCIFFKKIQRS